MKAATASPRPGAPGLFCPCWGTPPASDAAWDDAARNLSVIAANVFVLESRYARLKQVNPKIVAIPYTLGPYLSRRGADYEATLRDHPDRFARDAKGNLITVPDFPNLVLMDLTNAGWRQQMASITAAAASKLDGAYVDSMGLAPITGTYTTAHPVDPSSKQPYSITTWMNAAKEALAAIKSAVGSKYIMVNGLNNGSIYAQGSKALADAKVDGAMSEAWIRGAKAPVTSYPSAKTFQLELDEMAGVQAKGKDFFAWTKTWSGGTAQQKAEWNTFALASFLLVNQGKGYYNFLPEEEGDRSVIHYAITLAAIGSPQGNYTQSNGVYSRQFSNGSVTVNPGAKTASITVKGGATTTTRPGQTTTTRVGQTTTTRPGGTTTTTIRRTTTTTNVICRIFGC